MYVGVTCVCRGRTCWLMYVCIDVRRRLFGFRDEKKTEAVPKLQLHVPEALLEADITEVCCTYHHVCTVCIL